MTNSRRTAVLVIASLAVLAIAAAAVLLPRSGASGAQAATGAVSGSSSAPASVTLPQAAWKAVPGGDQAIYVLGQTMIGTASIVRVEGRKAGTPVDVSVGTNYQLGPTSSVVWGDGSVWLADGRRVLRIDPATGSGQHEYEFGAPSESDSGALEGAWISGLGVNHDWLVAAFNGQSEIALTDLRQGTSRRISIPKEFAGAQSVALDADGFVYLANAVSHSGSVLAVSPEGTASVVSSQRATALAVGPDGTVVIPDGTGCQLVRAAKPQQHLEADAAPTACEADRDSVVAWNVESGRVTVVTSGTRRVVEPTWKPLTVSGPDGSEVRTTAADLPRVILMTSNGEAWALAGDGLSLWPV